MRITKKNANAFLGFLQFSFRRTNSSLVLPSKLEICKHHLLFEIIAKHAKKIYSFQIFETI